MGQFSWLDCKTGEQIYCDERSDVYVLIPLEFGGGHIKEEAYEGYGEFGRFDIYDLVVDWNIKYIEEIYKYSNSWVCGSFDKYKEDFNRVKNGSEPIREKRILGIQLACYDEDNVRLRYPIKITHDKNAVYEYCSPSMSDPNQGWHCR